MSAQFTGSVALLLSTLQRLDLSGLQAIASARIASLAILAIFAITLFTASVADCKSYRISNRLVLTAFAALVPIRLMLHFSNGNASPLVCNAIQATLGAGTLFAMTFMIWLLGGFGGGDVKLLTLIGFVIGAERGIAVLMLAQVFAVMFIMARFLIVSVLSTNNLRSTMSPIPMAGFFSAAVLVVLCGGLYR